jgi:thiamine-monophosphate kinase
VADTPRLDEFERIRRFFRPLAGAAALGLADDAAVIDPPPGRQLVATVDAVVAGVHFLPEDAPELVARKLLRVNLSDLAAMGAAPLGYLLTTALPAECGEDWLAGFAAGLSSDQAEFGIALLGGDSVATPGPASFTLTALGTVAAGAAIRRAGAQPGDLVYVSGTLGDAALGLAALRGGLASLAPEHRAFLVDRYHLPRPRLALGARLAGIARAMIDVSDGLVADLGHVSEVSQVAAAIEAERVPLSPAAREAVRRDPALLSLVLSGGDDYELAFSAPPEMAAGMAELAQAAGVPLARIGRIERGAGVRVYDAAGREVALVAAGFRHF